MSDFVVGIAGIALAIIFWALPNVFPKMPNWIFRVGIFVGILLICLSIGLVIANLTNNEAIKKKAHNSASSSAVSASNTIGNVTSNIGIITQDQIGNNTMIIKPIVRAPDGLYQADKKVATVKNPIVDQSKGIITFQVINFTEFPNPSKPLKYKKYLIHCPDIPHKIPHTFVAKLIATDLGEQCNIIK